MVVKLIRYRRERKAMTTVRE
jgi:hypothetical protein